MKHRHLLLCTISTLALLASQAFANPLGPNVVAGDASTSGLGTPGVVVDQSSDEAIIDWRSFDIGSSESTIFKQPNSSSVTLNRVTGGLGASQILGTLKANGQIFLINPDGVLIGKDATIDVGALVATTHDLVDGDFLKGNYSFALSGKPDASVVNLGKITVSDGGFAALVAPGVRNAGTITARMGKVSLASAQSFSLDPYGDGLIKLGLSEDTANEVIDLSTGKPLSALVGNDGRILADGGLVQLSAAATRKVIDAVVNNTGFIEADSVGTKNGKIVLSAATASSKPTGAPTQAVKVSDTLSASGKHSGETGGRIEITGEQIALAEATIDAFGWNGGGQVLVGGDHGHNSDRTADPLPTASATTVDKGTIIEASATGRGNGGNVVVWSDGDTIFDGTIIARGGESSGNGGFTETSGRQRLAYAGAVDLSAPRGGVGTLFLDPQDITIGTIGQWVVSPAAIEAAIPDADVVISTNMNMAGFGDITVASDLTWKGGVLYLFAAHDIVVRDGVTISDTYQFGEPAPPGLNAGLIMVAGVGFDPAAETFAGTGSGTVIFNGSGKIDFTQSNDAAVSVVYNPIGGYAHPTDFTSNILVDRRPAFYHTAMLVNNAADLQNMTQNLSGDYAFSDYIDMSGFGPFTPIGDLAHPFEGIIESGLGSTIDHLTISSGAADVGLFGVLGSSAQVSGLNLTNASVTATAAGAHVGVLAGISEGRVALATATGQLFAPLASIAGGLIGENIGHLTPEGYLDGGVLSDSGADVAVSTQGANSIGDGGIAGGLVGLNRGEIWDTYAKGSVVDVAATPSTLGGLVGENASSDSTYISTYIAGSYATGTAISVLGYSGPYLTTLGGLVGINAGQVSESYAATNVVGSASNLLVGGLIGDGSAPTSDVWYSYWDVSRGGPESEGGIGVDTATLKSQLPDGFAAGEWLLDPGQNDGYPHLVSEGFKFLFPSLSVLAPVRGLVTGPNDATGARQVATKGEPKSPSDSNGPSDGPTVVSEGEVNSEVARLLNQADVLLADKSAAELPYWLWVVFVSFDSKWHLDVKNQRLFSFRGRTITGSDLNYYFEGVLFANYHIPQVVMDATIYYWKLKVYGEPPSADALWAAGQGYGTEVTQRASQ